jgi:PAS domain S-box-containing protein
MKEQFQGGSGPVAEGGGSSGRLEEAFSSPVEQDQLAAIVDAVPELIWISAADKRGVYVNKRWLDFTGRTKEQELGDGWVEGVHPDDRAGCLETYRRCFDARQPFTMEFRLRRHDGLHRWILSQGAPRHDSRGNFAGYVGSCIDITERKGAEDELQKARAHYQVLLETATDGIHVLNPEGELVEASASFYRMLGYSPENPPRLRVADWDARWNVDELKEVLKDLMEHPKVFETRHRRGDGRLIDVEINARRIEIDGRRYLYASSRDITERRRLEERARQSQKMEGIGHLAGGMAHEFNNILAAMMINLDLAKMASGEPEVLEGLREMEVLSRRAADLIRQLLAFSRQSMIHLQPLDLAEAVLRQRQMLQCLFGERYTLEFTRTETPAWVLADKGAVEQVILNLCLNARDAMKNGGCVRLAVSAAEIGPAEGLLHPDAPAGKYARLTVSDSGSGMDKETLKRLFEPFFTTKDIGKGAGLGLATVRGIVEQHRGWVDLESAPGKGSSFHVYLPAARPPAALSGLPADAAGAPGGATILLVEDAPMLRRATRAVLAREGYAVWEAADAAEALALWDRHRGEIDLLYTDMIMPGDLTGLQLARRLAADKPGLKVIITTGYYTDLPGGGQSLESGVVHLLKPCPPATLISAIRNSLRGPANERV